MANRLKNAPAEESADSAARDIVVAKCERGLLAPQGQDKDWAEAPRERLRKRLEKAKQQLFANRPLHARTHALANKAKQCAEELEKAAAARGEAQDALQAPKPSTSLRAEQAHAHLVAQQTTLQAELA
ncbi:unnamed protein product, partial [Prorocentrum cordatum]